ncbi:MAG: M20/M25/M40 family metallo-hydrolase, partial [Alphaproteobacteria bacterium]|nr:M20/M25/M40 family metallo-hydrolase [Alphaproteobacteria bacterium]
AFIDLVSQAVAEVTGRQPALTTTGGTSDARHIHHHCPVAEFGLIGQTMHKVDEQAAIADIRTLTQVYQRLLDLYFE